MRKKDRREEGKRWGELWGQRWAEVEKRFRGKKIKKAADWQRGGRSWGDGLQDEEQKKMQLWLAAKRKRAGETESTRLKKSKGQDPENAKNEKAEKKTRKAKDRWCRGLMKNETEEQKLERERKSWEKPEKSSALLCSKEEKLWKLGLSEAEAKEQGREVPSPHKIFLKKSH